MKFECKPNLSNTRGVKVFDDLKSATTYLFEKTGVEMYAQDWNIIGKLSLPNGYCYKNNKLVKL